MLLASYVIFFVPMFLNMCCSLLCNKLFSVCSSCYHNMQRGFQNYFNTFKLFHILTIIFNLIYTTLGFLGVLNNFNISFYIIIAIWIFTSIFKHELIQSETSPMKQKILSKLISIYSLKLNFLVECSFSKKNQSMCLFCFYFNGKELYSISGV